MESRYNLSSKITLKPFSPSLQAMFYAVVVTGSPRETTEGDVRKFFEEVVVKEVKFQTDERGWRTGNSIYVQLETSKDFDLACARDGQLLLSQKVGVLMISKADYEKSTGSTGGGVAGGVAYNGAYNQGGVKTVSLMRGWSLYTLTRGGALKK